MKSELDVISEAEHYREVLLAKKSQMLAEIGSRLPGPAEPGRVSVDDQVPVAHDEFICLQIERLTYCTLKEIDAALDRMATGDYGVCAACGDAISPRRLAAIPWAANCIRCQEHRRKVVDKLDARAA